MRESINNINVLELWLINDALFCIFRMYNDDLEVKEEIIALEDLVISLNTHEKQQCMDVEEGSIEKCQTTVSDYTFISKTDVDLDYLNDETIEDIFYKF